MSSVFLLRYFLEARFCFYTLSNTSSLCVLAVMYMYAHTFMAELTIFSQHKYVCVLKHVSQVYAKENV